jgi:hypothetical protein
MKKPRQPKKNASLQSWKNYETRLKQYEEKIKLIARLKARSSKI